MGIQRNMRPFAENEIFACWSLGESGCRRCRPGSTSGEIRENRRMLVMPANAFLPFRPCPIPFSFPGGRTNRSYLCPNHMQDVLLYRFGAGYEHPPGAGLCSIHKSPSTSMLIQVSLAL